MKKSILCLLMALCLCLCLVFVSCKPDEEPEPDPVGDEKQGEIHITPDDSASVDPNMPDQVMPDSTGRY
ncbi:MAG: hypothetical protein IJY50_01820 [Clostridia bacterium]|nr:hypothetical protein [Clostridia bacterium]